MEVLRSSPTVIVDAGHNPHGLGALVPAVEEAFGFRHLVAVVGAMADKDVEGMLAVLEPVCDAVVCVPVDSPRAMEVEELAAVAAMPGEPTQLIWQRLRRGIYHEAILSVEGVITLSDGRSFTDPTSAANAAQAVTDADGWRVWRVGVRGAHLGDLRDDLADRSS